MGALAVCLVAPPLLHTHASHSIPIATIAGQACTGGDAAAHLHAVSVRPAPACPACAAGPGASSALTASVDTGPTTPSVPLAGMAARPDPGARRAPARSRAPPCLPAA